MIRIHKPATAPVKLTIEGKIKTAEHCEEYAKNPGEYQSGKKTFSFSSNIYNHNTVKDALVLAQHKKCCFCERLIGHDGDVEHFRPKSAYTQNKKLERPGYYWLAYDWGNLYLSCSACNQRQKRNLFPIDDPQKRAHLHSDNITIEKPLFIDPGKDEPSHYIGFRSEMPFAINKRGKTTIENLGLDREILNDARLRHLQLMKALYQVIQLAEKQPSNKALQKQACEAIKLLAYAVSDRAEFSAATRAAVNDFFKHLLS
jgi:uncharacterized protein (TIGR02646 family)